MPQTKIDDFEILPAGEMQKKYHLYAENRREILLEPNHVPQGLRDLIPLAEKFGVSGDITHHDLGSKTGEEEKMLLSEALKGRHKEIARWLNDWYAESLFSSESYTFMQLCAFEMEECNGPSLPGKDPDLDARYDDYLSRRYGSAPQRPPD